MEERVNEGGKAGSEGDQETWKGSRHMSACCDDRIPSIIHAALTFNSGDEGDESGGESVNESLNSSQLQVGGD